MASERGPADSLERWSPALFLVSGGLLVLYSSLYAADVFLGTTYPTVRDVLLGPPAYVIGFLGLLGLYPALREHTPKLAVAGAVFSVLGIVGWLISLLGRAEIVTGVPVLDAAEIIFILTGFFLGFTVVGLAILRTSVHSRTVGLLLLLPAIVMVLNLAVVATGYSSNEARFLLSGAWGLSYVAIGYALDSDGATGGRVDAATT